MIVYEPNREIVTINKKEIPFYCGDGITPIALALLRLCEGEYSPQDAYDYILENIDYE